MDTCALEEYPVRDSRGPWYLLTGLILGLVMGLLYAWVVSPIRYVDTSPVSLRADFKDQYRGLIASAYAADHDLGRAQARMALLGDPDPVQILAAQAQRMVAEGASGNQAQALALLAANYHQTPLPATAVPTQTLEPTSTVQLEQPVQLETQSAIRTITASPQPSPTRKPTAVTPTITRIPPTPLPSWTPTITAGPPFTLQSSNLECDPAQATPQIEVFVENGAGDPVPGVRVNVFWDGGEDFFYTGLKPERGLGYGDFEMTPGTIYSLRLADGGQMVNDLKTARCTVQGQTFWGSRKLIFRQP